MLYETLSEVKVSVTVEKPLPRMLLTISVSAGSAAMRMTAIMMIHTARPRLLLPDATVRAAELYVVFLFGYTVFGFCEVVLGSGLGAVR